MNVGGCIRQPSGGPTMNVKGTAAGGGISLLIPMTEFSLGLTGDINNIMNAHNLAMVAATSRMQHEFNYDDAQLAKRNLKRLNIDPKNFEMGWIMDYCGQALRHIIIGMGGKMDGFMMKSSFGIAVSSEVMAILCVFTSLEDLRTRLNNMVVAYDKKGNPVTTGDLEVGNAMTAWMLPSINPTLMQTVEGQPCFVHAGPFANIAVGQSSIVADQIGLKLFDYHITESGFGADIGFEKFWNVKCRFSGLIPNVSVLTATVRGLKHHGVNAGALPCPPGKPVPKEYFSAAQRDHEMAGRGCAERGAPRPHHQESRHQPGGLHQLLPFRFRRRARSDSPGLRGGRRPGSGVQALAVRRRRRPGVCRCGHRGLQRQAEIQVPLSQRAAAAASALR